MNFDQDGWLDSAKENNISGNSWDRGSVAPTHLVTHGTAGGSDGNGTLTYEASVGVSTHFAISTNGDIWQGVPCNKAAWGNAPLKSPTINFAQAELNPNLWTISVEFCKPDTTNQIDITDAQKQSGFALIAAICDHYNIPRKQGDGNGGIIRHADINSVDRAHCPGTFPFDELWTFLGQEGEAMALDISQVSGYFLDIGTTPDTRWHCKSTGFDIAYGILTYYRTCTLVGLNGLSQYGLPTGPEQPLQGLKSVVVQHFERGIIAYDPAHEMDSVPGITGPCYPAHLTVGQATSPTIGSALSTLSTAQVTAQALSNAIGSVITTLKG